MYTHEKIWPYVTGDDDMDKTYYVCEQKDLLIKAVGLWGSTYEKEMKDFRNDDYIRLVGILLRESFRDRLDVIQDNRKSREILDDRAGMSKKACFEAAAECFKDTTVVISHPTRWNDVCEKHGDPEFNPNNEVRIRYPWNGDDMAAMYKVIMKKYKETMKNWTKGTGGGPGFPEDYNNWKARDASEYFNGYAEKKGGGLELTWIYMHDIALGLPLYSTFAGMPKAACFEDGEYLSGDESKSSVGTKVSKAMQGQANVVNDISKSLASTVGQLEQYLHRNAAFSDREKVVPRNSKRSLKEILEDVDHVDRLLKQSQKKLKRMVSTANKLEGIEKEMANQILKGHENEVDTYMNSKVQLLNEIQELNKANNGKQQNDNDNGTKFSTVMMMMYEKDLHSDDE